MWGKVGIWAKILEGGEVNRRRNISNCEFWQTLALLAYLRQKERYPTKAKICVQGALMVCLH